MKIRKATLKDYEQVKKLRTEFYLLEESTDERVKLNWVKSGMPIVIGKSLRNKNQIHYVAEKNKQLVGYAASEITKNPGWATYKKQGHLYNLYITPEYQKEGIGTKLLEKSLEWFKEKNIQDLKIMAYVENTRAKKLYNKHGFKDYLLTLKRINK